MTKVVISHPNFVENIRLQHGLSKQEADGIMRTVYDTISEGLINGRQIRLINIGKFELTKRRARSLKVPSTGKNVLLKERTGARFKVSKNLKKQIRNVEID